MPSRRSQRARPHVRMLSELMNRFLDRTRSVEEATGLLYRLTEHDEALRPWPKDEQNFLAVVNFLCSIGNEVMPVPATADAPNLRAMARHILAQCSIVDFNQAWTSGTASYLSPVANRLITFYAEHPLHGDVPSEDRKEVRSFFETCLEIGARPSSGAVFFLAMIHLGLCEKLVSHHVFAAIPTFMRELRRRIEVDLSPSDPIPDAMKWQSNGAFGYVPDKWDVLNGVSEPTDVYERLLSMKFEIPQWLDELAECRCAAGFVLSAEHLGLRPDAGMIKIAHALVLLASELEYLLAACELGREAQA